MHVIYELTSPTNNVIYQIKPSVRLYIMRQKRALEYLIYCEQEQQQAKVVEAKTSTGADEASLGTPLTLLRTRLLVREHLGELCILRN